MENVLIMNAKDNVAVCLTDAKAGQELTVENKADKSKSRIVLADDIPFAHKVALKDTKSGGEIIKYGEIIGRATKDIKCGEWVHVHNVESCRARGDQHVK